MKLAGSLALTLTTPICSTLVTALRLVDQAPLREEGLFTG
jgi:hypothetical protein